MHENYHDFNHGEERLFFPCGFGKAEVEEGGHDKTGLQLKSGSVYNNSEDSFIMSHSCDAPR